MLIAISVTAKRFVGPNWVEDPEFQMDTLSLLSAGVPREPSAASNPAAATPRQPERRRADNKKLIAFV